MGRSPRTITILMSEPGQTRQLRDRLIDEAATAGQSAQQQRRLTLEAELDRPGIKDSQRLDAQLELAGVLLDLNESVAAFDTARQALDACIQSARYEEAASVCQVMYLSEQPQAMPALGHGIWLALACPMDPNLTWEMLRHLVEETPPDSDGAAVAAMLTYFLMEKRAVGTDRDRLIFLARQQVGEVAERHRGITNEEAIGIWVQMYELDNVDVLLERMARILDAITPAWWFDREALRARFPSD